MRPRRSSPLLLVIGILNVTAGALGLIVTLVNLIGLIIIYVNKTAISANPLDSISIQNHIRLVRTEYQYIEIGGAALGFLFDLMLIASGFGLIWRQKWARNMALVWAVMSICNRLFLLGYSLFVVVPTMSAYIDTNTAHLPPSDPTKTALIVGFYIGVCLNGLLVFYPIIVFFLLLTKWAKEGFALQTRPREDDEDYEDEDYDDRRRPPRSRYRDDDRDDEDYDDRRRH